MKKVLVLSILGLAIIACSKKSTPATGTATSAPATPEQLVYEKVCTKCHGLKKPTKHSAAEWPGVVNEMQNKRGGHQFTDDDKAQILKYLTANAGR